LIFNIFIALLFTNVDQLCIKMSCNDTFVKSRYYHSVATTCRCMDCLLFAQSDRGALTSKGARNFDTKLTQIFH